MQFIVLVVCLKYDGSLWIVGGWTSATGWLSDWIQRLYFFSIYIHWLTKNKILQRVGDSMTLTEVYVLWVILVLSVSIFQHNHSTTHLLVPKGIHDKLNRAYLTQYDIWLHVRRMHQTELLFGNCGYLLLKICSKSAYLLLLYCCCIQHYHLVDLWVNNKSTNLFFSA